MRNTLAALLLAACSTLLPVSAHDDGGGGGGDTSKLRSKPFVSSSRGNASVSLVRRGDRVAYTLRKGGGTNTSSCGLNILGLDPDMDGEDFGLQLEIDPNFFVGDRSPRWEVHAINGNTNAEYVRYFYIPTGNHPDPMINIAPGLAIKVETLADGWVRYHWNHHDGYDAQDQSGFTNGSIAHIDHVKSIALIYDQPAANGQVASLVDNIAIGSTPAAAKELAR